MRYPSLWLVVGGSLFTVTLGSVLHFVYEWSGYSPVAALIAAVNESTWEHIKLGFWPLLIWALVEYWLFKVRGVNFVISKAVAIAVYCISLPILFYSYMAVLGDNYLFLDIGTFIVSVLLGQYIGYKILKNSKKLNLEKMGAVLILALIFAFLSFTFFPPENFLFKDPVSGSYGVMAQ